MQRTLTLLCGGLILMTGLGLSQVDGQEPAPNSSPQLGKKAKSEATGRLPNHYRQLDLTDAQKEQIYAVQGKHDTEIDKLEKQLADLKAKRDLEVEGVLTADQKKKLADVVKASKEKALQKKQAAKARTAA